MRYLKYTVETDKATPFVEILQYVSCHVMGLIVYSIYDWDILILGRLGQAIPLSWPY